MSENVVNIPIGQLCVNAGNALAYTGSDIGNIVDSIVDSIKVKGFVGSIDVIKNEGGKYTIVNGVKRYKAAAELGLQEIPCKICTVSDDAYSALTGTNVRKENFFKKIFTRIFGREK